MPETLGAVGVLLDHLESALPGPVTLLVVPGRAWTAGDLALLRRFVYRGHVLAGHGWHHRIDAYGGLWHRVHSLLLSRDVAEHLACDSDAIPALIRRCRGWFEANELPMPELYVPPAWAMGRISPGELARTGFRYFETLAGIRDVHTGRFHPLPVVGFEADTWFRALVLRAGNVANRIWAGCGGHLRLAIHPRDAELLLAADLERHLRRYASARSDAVLPPPDTGVRGVTRPG